VEKDEISWAEDELPQGQQRVEAMLESDSGYAFGLPPGWQPEDPEEFGHLGRDHLGIETDDDGEDTRFDAVISQGTTRANRMSVVISEIEDAEFDADEIADMAEGVARQIGLGFGVPTSEVYRFEVGSEPAGAFDYTLEDQGLRVAHRHAFFVRKGLGFFLVLSCPAAEMESCLDAFDFVTGTWAWRGALAGEIRVLDPQEA